MVRLAIFLGLKEKNVEPVAGGGGGGGGGAYVPGRRGLGAPK